MSNEVNKINWELVREMSAQYGHIVPNMRFGEFNVVPNGSNFAPGVDMTPKWDIPDKVMINTTVTGGFFNKHWNGKRCGFSKRYFLVLVACRHLTCTKTECRKMFLSLIAPLTTIRLNRGKRSNRLPYIFAQGQER